MAEIGTGLDTWTRIIEDEETGNVGDLGHVAEALYAGLGEAQATTARLRAELHSAITGHPGKR